MLLSKRDVEQEGDKYNMIERRENLMRSRTRVWVRWTNR